MKMIRVVAVGLMVAAVLITECAQAFFTYWMSAVPFNAWALTIQSLGQPVFTAAGIGVIGASVLILLSTGVGLFISATLYAPLESICFGFVEALCRRHEKSDYAQHLRRHYLPWLQQPKG